MGGVLSCADPPHPRGLVPLAALSVKDGDLVLVRWQPHHWAAQGPAPDVSYMLQAPHWEAFHSAGFLVTGPDGTREALLASPTGSGIHRTTLEALAASDEVQEIASGPLFPRGAPAEGQVRRLRAFAAACAPAAVPDPETPLTSSTKQLEDPRWGQRVQLLSGRGRKVFMARLVAEMLVAAGAFERIKPTLYAPRRIRWSFPDLAYVRPAQTKGGLPQQVGGPPLRHVRSTPTSADGSPSRPRAPNSPRLREMVSEPAPAGFPRTSAPPNAGSDPRMIRLSADDRGHVAMATSTHLSSSAPPAPSFPIKRVSVEEVTVASAPISTPPSSSANSAAANSSVFMAWAAAAVGRVSGSRCGSFGSDRGTFERTGPAAIAAAAAAKP